MTTKLARSLRTHVHYEPCAWIPARLQGPRIVTVTVNVRECV